MTNEQIARAFSTHEFDKVYDHLAPDATWNLVGQARIEGRAAIVEACRESTAEFAGVETTWLRLVSAGSHAVVAVDAIGRYEGPDSTSTVSSCDIYEFDGDTITTITSYAVELPVDAPVG